MFVTVLCALTCSPPFCHPKSLSLSFLYIFILFLLTPTPSAALLFFLFLFFYVFFFSLASLDSGQCLCVDLTHTTETSTALLLSPQGTDKSWFDITGSDRWGGGGGGFTTADTILFGDVCFGTVRAAQFCMGRFRPVKADKRTNWHLKSNNFGLSHSSQSSIVRI